MDCLSFPLEVRRDGSLARAPLEATVADLIVAAARTPSGTCTWCPEFGIRDHLEKQMQTPPGQPRPQLMREATQLLNAMIETLAGPVCQVEIKPAGAISEGGGYTFEIKIVWTGGATTLLSLADIG